MCTVALVVYDKAVSVPSLDDVYVSWSTEALAGYVVMLETQISSSSSVRTLEKLVMAKRALSARRASLPRPWFNPRTGSV